jgi:N-acyl-D-amino-acid deacylase
VKDHDFVICNVLVADGTGAPLYSADVCVTGERITAIGRPGSVRASNHVDAQGHVLAPGFIDVHTHDDRAVLAAPAMLPKLTQGVTTVVTGNCGISLAPWCAAVAPPPPLTLLGDQSDFRFARFGDYLDCVDRARPAVNVAAIVGHATLRMAHMASTERAANATELAAMEQALAAALADGAFGFSSGLFYKVASAASNAEVVALAKLAGRCGAVYTSHIRDEYAGVLDAIDEAVDAAEAARVPVVLSHHKCAGPANWGRSVDTLQRITDRRRRHPVGLDAYPYIAGSSVLDPALVDGVIRIIISWSAPHPEATGRDLADIAAEWGLDQKEAAARLMPGGAVYFQMDESDVRRVLAYPHTMIGSDGLPLDRHPHPRLWGTFPRVLGHYCREKRLFHLAEAVHRMTGLSAATFGLPKRGRIAVGGVADLVLFNPETVIDQATFADPTRAATGILMVWVNGVLALENGAATGARAGKALRRDQERFDCAPAQR